MMRGHIVPDVWKFVQTDAHVGDLGVRELSSRFGVYETGSPSWR